MAPRPPVIPPKHFGEMGAVPAGLGAGLGIEIDVRTETDLERPRVILREESPSGPFRRGTGRLVLPEESPYAFMEPKRPFTVFCTRGPEDIVMAEESVQIAKKRAATQQIFGILSILYRLFYQRLVVNTYYVITNFLSILKHFSFAVQASPRPVDIQYKRWNTF